MLICKFSELHELPQLVSTPLLFDWIGNNFHGLEKPGTLNSIKGIALSGCIIATQNIMAKR